MWQKFHIQTNMVDFLLGLRCRCKRLFWALGSDKYIDQIWFVQVRPHAGAELLKPCHVGSIVLFLADRGNSHSHIVQQTTIC